MMTRILIWLAGIAVIMGATACAADDPAVATVIPEMSAAAPVRSAGVGADADEAAHEAKLNQGRIIALTECSTCHAVGVVGSSPREDAPPLRTVLLAYNTATLEMDLMEGIRVGHADMPRFTFDPRTVDALIVYLESIQDWGVASGYGASPRGDES